jgi:hypothetical protein
MAKETINRAGIYSRYLRNAKTSGVFFLGWFGIVFVLVFIFKAPLNEKERSIFATFIKNFHLGIDL